MNHRKEMATEHPLFRALVLMGGGLALSCGGIAERNGVQGGSAGVLGSGGPTTSTAGSGGASASAAGASDGGTASTVVGFAGASEVGGTGAAGNPNDDPGQPACPFAQWDCSYLPPTCSASFSGLEPPAGCFCNKLRPLSGKDCQASETFVCLGAWNADAIRGKNATWDGQEHYQCACAPQPAPDAGCVSTCRAAYPNVQSQCAFPPENTCDSAGNCTATSADILRQEGVLCGCADLGLK